MKQAFTELNKWFSTQPGKRLALEISDKLDEVIPKYSGVHLLQCGIEEQVNWLHNSHILYHHILTPFYSHRPHALMAELDKNYLPILSDSIHLTVLPFCLELLPNTHFLLQEVYRVLREDGHLIIIGLNPYSALGLRYAFRQKALSNTAFSDTLSLFKLSKLLARENFVITKTHRFHYAPGLNIKNKTHYFFDHLGKMIWPYPANFYMVEAKKSPSIAITPIMKYGNLVIGRPN